MDFTEPSVVVIGNEADGLDDATIERCDETISIPMDGRSESLNAGVAASLIAFEALFQRRDAGRGPRHPVAFKRHDLVPLANLADQTAELLATIAGLATIEELREREPVDHRQALDPVGAAEVLRRAGARGPQGGRRATPRGPSRRRRRPWRRVVES